MDLRGILNTADNGDRPPTGTTQSQQPQQPQPPRAPQPPPHHPQYQTQLSQSPSTPLQAKTAYPHDYPHPPPHSSPGAGPHADFPQRAQRQQSMPYPGQSPYQSPAPHPPRPGPPSLPGAAYPDPRSPALVPRPPPGFGRASTTPLPGGQSSGSYFSGVHTPAEMTSPIQQHQQYQPQIVHSGSSREGGYGSQSQPGGTFAHSGSFLQSPVAQTPTTPATQGAPHHFPHQRSQSIHSVTNTSTTPTSAHSQHTPFGASAFHQQAQQQQQAGQQQRSPIATNRPPVPFNRQQSQPPVGSVPANTRPSSELPTSLAAYPSSPHSQHRLPSVGPAIPQQPQLNPQPQLPPQASPSTGPALGVPSRLSSTHTSPTQHHTELRTSQSQSDRGHSTSVSPKTNVPAALPSPSAQAMPSTTRPQQLRTAAPIANDRAMTPAKRKMDDRDVDEDMDRRDVRQRQADGVNGKIDPITPYQKVSRPEMDVSRSSSSPVVEKKKKRKPKRYSEPPPWARSHGNNTKLKHPNYELPRKKPVPKNSPFNGQPPAAKQQSRHASPEAARNQAQPAGPPAPTAVNPHAEITAMLGPWEPTIANLKPLDEVNKAVADFLFLNVVNNPDSSEIASHGIAFEIEAKLGQAIDRDTNERVSFMVKSECVIDERARLGFKSSMTEAQHKGLNDFLNQMVLQTDPRSPASGARVQVHYKHRREEDKYFELGPSQRDMLPHCVRSLMHPRQAPRARVTYDQRTREVLAKIVKVRIADMHIHMPNQPVDCRISINLEMDWPGPVEQLEQSGGGGGGNPPRQKDRLSYAQGSIQVDLTQVTMSAPGAPPRGKEHELEIELSPKVVVEQGKRLMSQEPHKYPELVESFVDNIRLLSRKVNDFR